MLVGVCAVCGLLCVLFDVRVICNMMSVVCCPLFGVCCVLLGVC